MPPCQPLVIPRQESVDIGLLVAAGDGGQRSGEPCVGIDGVKFAGLDERGDHRPVLRACVVTCEESVLAVECDGADGAFDGVAVDFDAAILEETGQSMSAPSAISSRRRPIRSSACL